MSNALDASRARVRRYRSKNRRIDYTPAPDVLQIIERHLVAELDNCWAGVIDRLVRLGHEAISGNGRAIDKKSGNYSAQI